MSVEGHSKQILFLFDPMILQGLKVSRLCPELILDDVRDSEVAGNIFRLLIAK